MILYDVEILVDGERRVVGGTDVDEHKVMLENRIVLDGKQVFCVQVGEVPPGKEVSVKCTYATELSIEGRHLNALLLHNVTPSN